MVLLCLRAFSFMDRSGTHTKQATRAKGKLVVSQPKTHNFIRVLLVEAHKKHPKNPYMFPLSKTGKMFHSDSLRHTHQKIVKAIGAGRIGTADKKLDREGGKNVSI